MGWLDSINAKKKDKVPDRFKDKNEDDILKMLDEADKATKEVETLKAKDAERETQVTKIQTEFESVKAKLAAAEANVTPPKPKADEELANFVEEPDKAFSQRVGPVANIALQTAAMTARMLAQQQLNNMDMSSSNKTMDGRLFQAWSGEIDVEAKKYQTIQLGNVNAWLGIFYYLKGIHADELRDPDIRKKKYNFMEPVASTVNTNDDGKDKTPSDQLTDAEKHVADKMGVKHEDYLKRKKGMQFVNA